VYYFVIYQDYNNQSWLKCEMGQFHQKQNFPTF